jgi:hypothetical protein
MDRKKRLINRILIVSGLSAALLLGGYVLYLKRPSHHFHFPAGFKGWVTVKFEKSGAPELPLTDGALQFKIPDSGILETSTKLKDGWAKDHFYLNDASGKSEEVARAETVNGETYTRVHDYKVTARSYDSVIVTLPNPIDTVLWDGARISRNGDVVEVRKGRVTMLHFYFSAEAEPFFSKHDSLPASRMHW